MMSMMTNPIKAKIVAGGTVIGVWSIIPSPIVVEIFALGGMDFLILDMEHGLFDVSQLDACVRACEAAGAAPLVRTPGINPAAAQWALDIGGYGIVVPQVNDATQAAQVVAMAKFAPAGVRGYNPFTRAADYASPASNKGGKLNNEFSLTCLIVESEESLKNIDAICATPDLDVVYIGIFDLSVALGYGGNTQHPDLVELVNSLVMKIRGSGKAAGMMVRSEHEVAKATALGANFLVYSVDTALIRGAVTDAVGSFMRGQSAPEGNAEGLSR